MEPLQTDPPAPASAGLHPAAVPTPPRHRGVTRAVLLLGALVTLGFMLWAGEPQRPAWWLGAAPFAAWALLPYALGWWGRRRAQPIRAARRFMRGACVALAASSAWMLTDAFVLHPDAQSGLVFAVLPLWQTLAMAIAVALTHALTRRA